MGSSMSRREFVGVAISALTAGLVVGQPRTTRVKPAPRPKSRPITYDDDGLIVHTLSDLSKHKFDGGDTAQREGWYWVGRWVREKVLNDPWPIPRSLDFSQVLRLLEPKQDGVFYRHPKLAPWNNPFDKEFGFSIDQMTALVAAMGLWGHTDALRRLWNRLPQDPTLGSKHTFNGALEPINVAGIQVGGYYTGDLVFGKSINLFRRAWGEDPMKAGDGNGPWGEVDLSGLACLRAHPKDLDDTGDDLNLIVMLLMAILRYPVPRPGSSYTLPTLPSIPGLEKANEYIKNIRDCNQLSTCTDVSISTYKRRTPSYGSYLEAYQTEYGGDEVPPDDVLRNRLDAGIKSGWKSDNRHVLGAVRWYHRPQIGANPQLADLYDPIIRRYFEP